MNVKIITAIVLFSMNGFVHAAKEIRHSEMANMAQPFGSVTVTIRNGTLDEANKELSKKADKKGAKYYRITSIGMDGMGSNLSASAEIYK